MSCVSRFFVKVDSGGKMKHEGTEWGLLKFNEMNGYLILMKFNFDHSVKVFD